MPNQLPKRLQNLLSKQSQNINLISSEFNAIEVTEDQNSKFENIFLIITICLTSVLGFLLYQNYKLNTDVLNKNYTLSEKIENLKSLKSSTQEINSKIEKLELYKKINSQRVKIAAFFEYYGQVITFFQKDSIVSSKYAKDGNNINFEVVVNSSNPSLDQDINSYIKSSLLSNQLTKVSEVNIPETNLKQYKFQGKYELR